MKKKENLKCFIINNAMNYDEYNNIIFQKYNFKYITPLFNNVFTIFNLKWH
jgi:UDP-N-acetylglucosamine 2-epimerase